MSAPFRFLSVCSGIEAASVAWKPLGWECAGVSEIEPFPRAVLEQRHGAVAVDWDHRWQQGQNFAPLFGDFTKIEDHHVGPVDLLVGGTPCQDFSIAGLRSGLDGERGNLTLEFARLADQLRSRWLVWENVPGVFSSNGGRDFGAVLASFSGRHGHVFAPPADGWRNAGVAEPAHSGAFGLAWRVLDAQYVRVGSHPRAVPQRRRRVFIVGYIGDWHRAAAVLFDRESLCGNPPPRRESGQRVAPTISARPTGGGGLGTDFDCDGGLICADVAPTLNAAFGDKLGLEDQHIRGGAVCSLPAVSMCLNAGAMGQCDAESETLIPVNRCDFDDAVAHTLKGEGFDASEDGSGRGTPIVPVAFRTSPNCGAWETGDRVDALTTGTDRTSHIIAFSCKDHGADASDIAPTLRSMGHEGSHANGGGQVAVAYAIQAGALRENPDSGPDGIGVKPDAAYTLEARAEVQAVAFDMRGREGGAMPEGPHDTANIRAANGGSSRSYVATRWAVRRLTPRECERLQGFPDDFTAIKWRGKPAEICPDGPRYKALGNSMAVNVMRWIGERIAMVERAVAAGKVVV